MIIRKLDFVISAASEKQFPDIDMPEVAFAGRSNVGKSSLMNMLLARRNFVKVSSTPGRTQQINFFNINDAFHLVDLPGYGFAKAPKAVRNNWQDLMRAYVRHRPQLTAAVLILDVRRTPGEEDFTVLDLFRQAEIPVIPVISKADKLPLQKRGKQVQSIAKRLGLFAEDCHVTSAVKTMGKERLWSSLECFLEQDEGPA